MANQDTDLRCYLTNAGIAAENNSIQLGRKLPVKEIVFGSGLLPDASDPREQTSIITEEYAVPCGRLFDPENPTLLVFKGDLPVDVGGFHIHEVAIRLEDGTIYGYARGKGDYKPTLAQGSTDSSRYAIEMYTTNASIVECKVDLSKVYADWEDLEVLIKAHKDEVDPHPQYATEQEVNQLISNSQFQPYNAERRYTCGEICYTKDESSNELTYWQWYSNVESLAGKSPLDLANRHLNWAFSDKPFYWLPYTGDQVGMPFFWLDTVAPEWAVMEINVDLPVAVYWRLARRYPSLVFNRDGVDYVNTGEIRGEFLRVLDQGRGIDANRQLNSYQAGTKIAGEIGLLSSANGHTIHNIGNVFGDPVYESAAQFDTGIQYVGSNLNYAVNNLSYWATTRARNVARPMAITI